MEKKSGSKIKKLIHARSQPILFGFNAPKVEGRRKSEGKLKVPENIEKTTTPFWFLKEIETRDAAEELLGKTKIGTFLVRNSETAKFPGCYTLSIRHKDGFKHHKIETNPINSKLVIRGNTNHQFDDLEKLVEFFIRSQKQQIYLIPYNPNAKDQEDGVDNTGNTEQQPYEVMQGSEYLDGYQEMEKQTCRDKPNNRISPGPPPLPTRREPLPSQSYENLNPSRKDVPLPPGPTQGYENVPPKDCSPVPLPPRLNVGPPLPPRKNKTGPVSYENIPERPPPRPENYENLGGHPSGYENYFKNGSQPQASHGHSYQNLPPKVTPRSRKTIAFSAEQELPPKPTVPLRRSMTDTRQDWERKGYFK